MIKKLMLNWVRILYEFAKCSNCNFDKRKDIIEAETILIVPYAERNYFYGPMNSVVDFSPSIPHSKKHLQFCNIANIEKT